MVDTFGVVEERRESTTEGSSPSLKGKSSHHFLPSLPQRTNGTQLIRGARKVDGICCAAREEGGTPPLRVVASLPLKREEGVRPCITPLRFLPFSTSTGVNG